MKALIAHAVRTEFIAGRLSLGRTTSNPSATTVVRSALQHSSPLLASPQAQNLPISQQHNRKQACSVLSENRNFLFPAVSKPARPYWMHFHAHSGKCFLPPPLYLPLSLSPSFAEILTSEKSNQSTEQPANQPCKHARLLHSSTRFRTGAVKLLHSRCILMGKRAYKCGHPLACWA